MSNINEANYLKSIELLGEQIKQSYAEAGRLQLPSNYGQINKIAVFGMGGSQLGVDLISSLMTMNLSVPIVQIRNYSVPAFVDEKTLVLLISYSGGTEEVLHAALELMGQKNKVIAITVGGKLAEVAKKNKWPVYQINPVNNPSGQPRMGTGYVIGSLIAILKKLKLLAAVGDAQVKKLATSAKATSGLKLKAKKLALALKNKTPLIVSAEHLQGHAHIMTNQINESAKQGCYYFALPELNHHLLEGLSFPVATKKSLYFLFINSGNYLARIKKRFVLTEQVTRQQGINGRLLSVGGDRLTEAGRVLTLGALLSYELAKLNKVEPDAIPWVNYFKKQLGK